MQSKTLSEPRLTQLIKENRIFIRVEFRQSSSMNFVSPFQPNKGAESVQTM